MTLEQVKVLTDEELRIKVAELLGWQCIVSEEISDGMDLVGFSPDGTFDTAVNAGEYRGYGSLGYRFVLPNFTKDLNECHEMEKALWSAPDRWLKYVDLLQTRKDYENGAACAWVSATARQRCEAFILTIGE